MRVTVKNDMMNGEGIIMHWHGMEMQDNSQADGGGRVTQCPIPAHNSWV